MGKIKSIFTKKEASPSNNLITKYRKGFGSGFNVFLSENDDSTGMGLGIHRLQEDETVTVSTKNREVALTVFFGEGELLAEGRRVRFKRADWITEEPTVIHVPCNTELAIKAHSYCEVIETAVPNPQPFEIRLYEPAEIRSEWRGKGTLNEAATRIVRTAFDHRNSPQFARLVLGEVVTWPGRWSSYPPHWHEQPELYYYRFKMPQGYGHAEMGDEIFKVRDRDLLRITDCRGHAQVAAPGYFMYYLWVVRHLPGKPYTGFTYFPEHEWTTRAKNAPGTPAGFEVSDPMTNGPL
ncbi:MAG: 5-deoxy-glucuronate isomerase [Elusimicrobia bacterium]|nr:5-deoxy-glucuronate isomerase [Elusimicrobiota bacterium]